MKNPPTLADACIATSLDRTMPWHKHKEIAALLGSVAYARKIVLDDAMSAYLWDLSYSLWKGGLRKRLRGMNNVRQLARLPHTLTWIEFNNLAYVDRNRKSLRRPMMFPHMGEWGKTYQPEDLLDPGVIPNRVGWLLEQHSKIDTAFRMFEIRDSGIKKDRVFINPVALAWSANEDVIPWKRFDIWDGHDFSPSEAATHMEGYVTDRVYPTRAYSDADGAWESAADVYGNGTTMTSARDTWVLLATINDLPVSFEHIEPSKGYVSRGSYKKFLKHSIVHLTVPETRWHKSILKTSAILRRRAHQVRGHWRVDWRNRPSRICEHDWNELMVCRRCSGHYLWVAEHQRGDASMGFVTHDYAVHHDLSA